MTETGAAPSPEGITSPAEFVAALRDLRQWSGLTYRQLAAKAQALGEILPVSTVASALGRTSLPRREVVAALARACGLTETAVDRWLAVRGALAAGPDNRPRTAAATMTAPVVPHQLPADVPGFVGRARELAELDRLGEEGLAPLGVVSGMAGLGKTALAVHWGHRARDRFPDGQLYVNLRGYGPGPPLSTLEALNHLITALGVPPQQVPGEEQQAAGLFRSLATDRRLLVVLDNAASPEQVRPLLPGGSGSAVVVTSRDRLSGLTARDGAYAVELPELSPEHGVQLLTRIVGAERVGREGEAASELVRMCGVLPLALRIAAATIDRRSALPIADFVRRLQSGNRLATLGIPGDPQSAIAAAFEDSYEALGDELQRIFRLLGLVPVPEFSACTVAALAVTSVPVAEDLLRRLADAHLVNRLEADRYGMHDLLREYAGSLCAAVDPDAERTAALRRAYESYLHHAEAAARILYPQLVRLPLTVAEGIAFDAPRDAARWLTVERHNLIVIALSAAQQGLPEVAWLLSSALRGYFMSCRDTAAWQTVARAALEVALAQGDLAAQASCYLSLGLAYLGVGAYQPAIAHCEQAVRLGARSGWADGQSAALNALGVSHSYLGEIDEAIRYLNQSLELKASAEHGESLAAVALNNLGTIHIQCGQLDLADEQMRASLALHRKLGTRRGVASALLNLATIEQHRGDFAGAHRIVVAATEIYRELQDIEGEATALTSLAAIELLLDHRKSALEHARTAIAARRRTGDAHGQALALHALAMVRRGLGDNRLALRHQRHALRLANETGGSQAAAMVQLGIAELYLQLGNYHLAEHYARQARNVAEAIGYRPFEGTALRILATVALRIGELNRADRRIVAALEIHRHTGYRVELSRAETVRREINHHLHAPQTNTAG